MMQAIDPASGTDGERRGAAAADLGALRGALDAVEIRSPTVLSWFSHGIRVVPRSLARTLSPEAKRRYLVAVLRDVLYAQFYCLGRATPVEFTDAPRRHAVDTISFAEKLARANHGPDYDQSGWELIDSARSGRIVRRDGLELLVPHADGERHATPACPGTTICLRFRHELPNISPGFYMAVSGDVPTKADRTLVRLYWNVTHEAALRLMRSLTEQLSRALISYRFKVLTGLNGRQRADSAVLYICRDDYERTVDMIGPIYDDNGRDLHAATPAFTKRLAPGLALAETPPGAASFGIQRSGLVAEALVRCHEAGRTQPRDRLAAVADEFEHANLDLAQPFLNPGGTDVYRFGRRRWPAGSAEPAASPATAPSPERCRDFARQIGERLCRDAIWHMNRCTWIAANAAQSGSQILGADLYDGVSGVALFLAELHAATGCAEAGRTADGAIRQALAVAGAMTPRRRIGLYSGCIGVALAAVRVGRILGLPDLLSEAGALVRHIDANSDGADTDVMSGLAGAMIGLAALGRLGVSGDLLGRARRLADDLISRARRNGTAASWRTINVRGERDLSGLSHGAAGIGLAFADLFHETGGSNYRAFAEMAFEYERRSFDRGAGNWFDFRGRLVRDRAPGVFGMSWCHGAPGIVLCSLRARALLECDVLEEDARLGLKTIAAAVASELSSRRPSLCLCHGLLGNAEVLLASQRVVPGAADASLAHAAAGLGIASNLPLASITARDGHAPDLMVGDAGVGHFYLRLHDHTVPSVLDFTQWG